MYTIIDIVHFENVHQLCSLLVVRSKHYKSSYQTVCWILSLQAYCEVQDNISSIHATEQKILTLPCWDHKISAHFLQQSHGNVIRKLTYI